MPVDAFEFLVQSAALGRTLETASSGPLTLRIRSGFPGILSETMTRAPLFSRISLTCEPPFPMMMEASWVTIKHRMWMFAAEDAAPVELDAAALGAAEVVADDASAVASVGGASPELATGGLSVNGDGVDAAVSATAEDASILLDSERAAAGDWIDLVCASSDVAPVLGRLCLGWSASEGERDRLRVASASGMVVNLVGYSSVQLWPVRKGARDGRVWEVKVGVGRTDGFGVWKRGAWTVRWGMREGREDCATISTTHLLHGVLNGEHDSPGRRAARRQGW